MTRETIVTIRVVNNSTIRKIGFLCIPCKKIIAVLTKVTAAGGVGPLKIIEKSSNSQMFNRYEWLSSDVNNIYSEP